MLMTLKKNTIGRTMKSTVHLNDVNENKLVMTMKNMATMMAMASTP